MKEHEKQILDLFQRDFPLSSRPFAEIGQRLGIGEDEVINTLERLQENGTVSRVGAVFRPGSVGQSQLAAMEVPEDRFCEVAEWISSLKEVNHNYEREHRFNLWFVITAPDLQGLKNTVEKIERHTGIDVMELPMEEEYRLDLGFALKWN